MQKKRLRHGKTERQSSGIKLSEVGEKYKGKYIKIGARSGFIFIGRIDESFPALLSEWDIKYPEIAKRAIKKTTAEIRKIKETISYLEAKSLTRDGLKKEEKARLDKLPKTLENSKQKKENYERYIKEFTPFEDRAIIDEYNSIDLDERTDKIIIIDGQEIGRYWLRSEAETGIIEEV